jgi:hypothetical protein
MSMISADSFFNILTDIYAMKEMNVMARSFEKILREQEEILDELSETAHRHTHSPAPICHQVPVNDPSLNQKPVTVHPSTLPPSPTVILQNNITVQSAPIQSTSSRPEKAHHASPHSAPAHPAHPHHPVHSPSKNAYQKQHVYHQDNKHTKGKFIDIKI